MRQRQKLELTDFLPSLSSPSFLPSLLLYAISVFRYAIHDTSKPTEFKLISYDLKTAEDVSKTSLYLPSLPPTSLFPLLVLLRF